MVLPLLALLPGLFSAIGSATELFDRGRAVYQAVTGQPSAATSAEALQGEVAALPEAQAKAWVDQMAAEVERYRAENDRLRIEQGEVSAELLAVLPKEAAATVAMLRMTTRPRVVLRMTHVMLVPVYVIGIDASVTYFNAICRLFGSTTTLPLLAPALFSEGGVYRYLYESVVPYATAVVLTFMLLRELGKSTSKPGDGDLGDLVGRVASMFGGLGRLFRKNPPAS